LGPPEARAVTNSATGGISGINNGTLSGGDGTGSAQVTFGVTDLALVKQARDLLGVPLPSGSNVAAGQDIYFVLFVDNTTPYPADDLGLTDLLDESQFTYVPGTLAAAAVPSGSNDATMWAATWTPLSDDVGAPDDPASITDTGGPAGRDRITIGAVASQTNQSLQIPGNTLRAIRFRVRVN
jgi:uncharacterized repeat protein (TIGR01451 family)